MQDDFSELREELPGIDITPLPGVDEGADLRRQWFEEQLDRVRQDRSERKAAPRIFLLACLWLAAILTLVALQGFLRQRGRFSLSDGVLIAIATTTTASVTALLVVVVRYLFRAPPGTRPAGRRARSGRAR